MKYVKQFDAMRGICILFVILYHWIPENVLIKNLPYGFNVVDVFFVLSGFFITKILIDSRTYAETQGIHKGKIYLYFITRRALRLFPIYYITIIAVNLLIHINKTELSYLLTYTPNFYFYSVQHWDNYFSHLWSLGVEEQFYIFWPLVVLLVPKKFMPYTFILVFLLGSVSEYVVSGNQFGQILPFTCFDSFGMGAFLSWLITYKPDRLKQSYTITTTFTVIISLYFFIELITRKWTFIPARLTQSFVGLWFINFILFKEEGSSKKVFFLLHNRLIVFFGKISYGVYLYHLILPNLTVNWLTSFNKSLPHFISKHYSLFFIENFILLIGLSTISYYYIERPFNRLGKRLAGGKRIATAAVPGSVPLRSGETVPQAVTSIARPE